MKEQKEIEEIFDQYASHIAYMSAEKTIKHMTIEDFKQFSKDFIIK